MVLLFFGWFISLRNLIMLGWDFLVYLMYSEESLEVFEFKLWVEKVFEDK